LLAILETVGKDTPKSERVDLSYRPQGRLNLIWVGESEKGLQREHETQKRFKKILTLLCSTRKNAHCQDEEEAEMQMPLDHHL